MPSLPAGSTLIFWLIIGGLLLYAKEAHSLPGIETVRLLAGAIGEAIVVAAILGLVFEWQRHRAHIQLLEGIEAQVQQLSQKIFRDFAATSNIGAFDIVEEMALNSDRFLTVFDLPRRHSENTLSRISSFFEGMAGSGRLLLIERLGIWLNSESQQLRFLASDVIGKYCIDELVIFIKQDIDELVASEAELPPDELEWKPQLHLGSLQARRKTL